MSVAGREFLTFRMEEKHYRELDEKQREVLHIYKVDVEGVDYSNDEQWNVLKKESVKAYKKLKDREYNIRHNKL